MAKRKSETSSTSPSKIKKNGLNYVSKEVDSMSWRTLKCAKSQLNLEIVLKCGQSFRWSLFRRDPKQFIGVLAGKVWVLTQNDDTLFYKTLGGPSSAGGGGSTSAEDEKVLQDYFQLNVDLVKFYDEWAHVDPVFKDISVKFSGVRMLRQDPVENIFAFICSSNNNIQRYTLRFFLFFNFFP